MARSRLSMHPFRAGILAWSLVVAALVLLSGTPGCSSDSDDKGALLDSTLVNSERLLDAGDATGARACLLKGLAGASGAWKGVQAAPAYRLLGDLSLQMAQLDSAAIFYRNAEASYRERVQRGEAFRMALARVGIHRLMQQEDDARAEATEALHLAMLFGDSAAVNEIRWTLLDVYRVLEQPTEMEQIATALRATCAKSGDVRGDAEISFLLGKAASERGEIDNAVRTLLQGVTLAGKARDSSLVAEILVALASTFEHAGKTREAQESYAAALQNMSAGSSEPSLRIRVLFRVGNFYLRNGRPDIAAQLFAKAGTLAKTGSNLVAEGYALLQRGHCQGGVDRTGAGSLFRQGYELLQNAGHAEGCAYALISMGQIAERENKVTDAAQIYRAALKSQESIYASRTADDPWYDCEEAIFGREGADAYGAMVSLLVQSGKGQEAFWYQERSNARRLADDLASWNIRTGNGGADSALQTYRHLRALHVGAERQLEELASSPRRTSSLIASVRDELNLLEEQISTAGERTRHNDSRLTAVVNTDGMSPTEAQRSLEADESLVVYLPTLRALYACVVTPSAVSVHMTATNPERVTRLAEQYLQQCALSSGAADSGRTSNRAQDFLMQQLTRDLYEAMVLPLEPALKPGNRLLVVLPAHMPAFSLAGLRRGGSLTVPALAERSTLSYLPTVRFLQIVKPARVQTRVVVALGVRGATAWDVEYELRDISAFYRNARMLFGKEATLAALQSMHADLLHLAVEVRFSAHHPMIGSFLLGDGETSDGASVYPLATVFSLPPVAGVVVSNLSSKLPTTDYTLAAAFLSNGASSVVTNAAPLSRKTKKLFGESFYTALQTGVSVSAAFRTAQNGLARSKEMSAPNFWAPLMVWGR